MRYTYKLKELAKDLCEKSGCHHKCNDTNDCVVEDEALLLINENKSNNFDVKSNNEIEEMARFMCSNYAGEGNCADGNKCDFDCWSYREAEHLYNAGYRKQSEGEWISNCQTDEFICSLCGAIAPVDCEKERFYKSNFCPSCGAKMKGGEE